ncbi:hypothetical protein [Paenibacillus eucommiae]|uniref:Nicotinamidase-related amidase n=1 Tax=Paenibacillus eucommiae TaxID=1355755 RepID=A0ABS4ISB9_9BACL|nr:hypothetical protein [Paenibacillus eucommiae]MBP1990474.1 nicotinamidase-related amidase [Paenibacillus eucommiae]
MGVIKVPTQYYQHFDADFSLEVPGEGYGGWKEKELPISLEHTAFVVMHAWDGGTPDDYPGWHRAVEYLHRSADICRDVLPPLLKAVRQSGMKVYHVVSDDERYYNRYPGFEMMKAIAGDEPKPAEKIKTDPVLEDLQAFRSGNVFPGAHNVPDIQKGFSDLRFPKEAEPQGDEKIAATTNQLYALCREEGVNHLIYSGFAINWCLLLSPGGMAEISKHGIMCSAVREAVTAVENKETAGQELNKALALWRVALAFGFVYKADDLIHALSGKVAFQ